MIDRTEEYKTKRKKRRIRRVIAALVFIAFATLLSWFFESQSTTTVSLLLQHCFHGFLNLKAPPLLF